MAVNPTHDRDGGKCVMHRGCQAQTVHHRNHTHRDNRPSNMISVCGSGTTGAHGWIEAHWTRANERGWTISKHEAEPSTHPVWYEDGPFGRGWYLLDDDNGFTGWPGSVATQGMADPPPIGEEHHGRQR